MIATPFDEARDKGKPAERRGRKATRLRHVSTCKACRAAVRTPFSPHLSHMGNNLTLRGASAFAILTLVSAVGCSDVTQPTTETRVTAPTTALASLTSGTG